MEVAYFKRDELPVIEQKNINKMKNLNWHSVATETKKIYEKFY
jgi:hypothetical protein